MKMSRLFSAVFVLLALALGTLTTTGCTTDGAASGSSSNGSTGGY